MKAASIVLVLTGLAWLASTYRYAESWRCCRCGHEFETEGTTLGPLRFGHSEKTTQAAVADLLLDKSHKHEWAFGSSYSRTLYSQTIGCPFYLPNPFAWEFNRDVKFRAHIMAKINSGDLTRETAARISLIDFYGEETPDVVHGKALVAEFLGDD